MKRTPLRRKPVRPWRRSPADYTDAAERAYVVARDGCTAAALGAPDRCRDTFGNLFDPRRRPDLLEVDHIRDEPMMGKRAPSDRRHMAAACPHHHRLGNPPWMTSNRDKVRSYLRTVERADDAA